MSEPEDLMTQRLRKAYEQLRKQGQEMQRQRNDIVQLQDVVGELVRQMKDRPRATKLETCLKDLSDGQTIPAAWWDEAIALCKRESVDPAKFVTVLEFESWRDYWLDSKPMISWKRVWMNRIRNRIRTYRMAMK